MTMIETEYSVEKPLNREPLVKDLVADFITTDGAYDRNHGPIPHLSHSDHIVKLSSPSSCLPTTLTLTPHDLATNYPQSTIVAALQCAGNRRHTMRTRIKEVEGIDWGDAAVMNCKWRGPRLRDVLLAAGVRDPSAENSPDDTSVDVSDQKEDMHVAFECDLVKVQEDEVYGSSVPLRYAMRKDADIILALEMNSSPLTSAHGAPVRVIIPGLAGARSVKWLTGIKIQPQESQNYYMQHDYKVLPPEAVDSESAEKWWGKVKPLMEMPVNSVIASPGEGDRVLLETGKEEGLEVRGYALPQGSHGPVMQVEVSVDKGVSWIAATLLPSSVSEDEANNKWSWALWQAVIPTTTLAALAPIPTTTTSEINTTNPKIERMITLNIISRATDKDGNTQSEDDGRHWNLRGVAYCGFGEARGVEVVLAGIKQQLSREDADV